VSARYIFPCPHKKKEKPIQEGAMGHALRFNYEAKKFSIGRFTPHDLRRTAVTHLAGLKVPLEWRERIVNQLSKELDATYNLYEYDEEKETSMKRWETDLLRILTTVGEWKGARLGALLEAVRPKSEVRYVVFHCADPMEEDGSSPYYESIDMEDAFHPQTILAYELNDEPLPVANGAPLRLRLERQLGYKMAKYVMRIELVEDFSKIAGGKGGYWEDQGYEWYAGI
jgi:DMSO/TMAO reductase YedYZ molybdopterin-dependent catalytic subunit